MTFEIGLTLSLVLVAVLFFAFEWVSPDVVGMGLLLALVITGLLTVPEAFASFGSETTIMVFSLLVMTAALTRTGMVDMAGRVLLRHTASRPGVLFLTVMLSAVLLSSAVSNTAATAFLVPVVLGTTAKSGIPPGQLLMPLAFSSILASSLTLVSTSTNLVVSGLMVDHGLPRMGMFELTPVGIAIASIGVTYLYFVGRRLIPSRHGGKDIMEEFGSRSYLSELVILPGSTLAGGTLADSKLVKELDLRVVRIVPAGSPKKKVTPSSDRPLEPGDVLVVQGAREEVLKVKDIAGIEIRPEVTLPEPPTDEELVVVEGLVVPGSPLLGRTVRGMAFGDRYGVQVLGIHRHGKNLFRELGRVVLRAGDLLLLQGRRSRISTLSDEHVFSAIGAVENRRVDRPRAWRVAAIFAGVLALATLGLLPLAVAGFLGVFLVFVTRCISPSDAYREVEWRPIILIACMLAFGSAMQSTGAAEYLAGFIVSATGQIDPRWPLAAFFLLTIAMTQPMSNQAAAAVILPIAFATAESLQLDPRPFAMMVAVAASCSYLTPLEPACLLVYGPGRYRFVDFARVGLPLTILIFAVACWLVPVLWPLTPVQRG